MIRESLSDGKPGGGAAVKQNQSTGDTALDLIAEATGLQSRRILVVDDNRDAADTATRLLTALGQIVVKAYDGPSAILVASEFKPEIIFLDLDMPCVTGFDVARTLSGFSWRAQTRLIAHTGSEDHLPAAIAAGFDDFIVKPATVAQLILILRS